MSALVQVTDEIDEGLGKLTSRFRQQPNVRALLSIFLQRRQDLQDSLWSIWVSRMLANNPVGDALDKLGRLVDCPRGTFNDIAYQLFIKIWIRARKSGGRSEDMLAILALSVLAYGFTYTDWDFARFDIYSLAIPDDYVIPVATALHMGRCNGVYGVFDYSTWPTPTNWTLADASGGSPGVGGYGLRDYWTAANPAVDAVPISCIAL